MRPLARASERPCARPGCPSPARSTLTFRYDSQEAALGPLAEASTPHSYDLCTTHADRTRPPRDWELVDQRPDDEAEPAGSLPAGDTVAVLAAALHDGDRAPHDPAPHDPAPGEPTTPGPVLAQRGVDRPSRSRRADDSDQLAPPEEREPDEQASDGTAADGRAADGDEPGSGSDTADGTARRW